jgi:hypothetical protein
MGPSVRDVTPVWFDRWVGASQACGFGRNTGVMDEPQVCVAEVADIYGARVYAAKLVAAGIPVRVHGETSGPYPLSIGQMAVTELWVGCRDLSDAEAIIAEEDDPVADWQHDGTDA